MNEAPPEPAARWSKLLVLDLDETLIHARGPSEGELPWPPHRRLGSYRVWLRPGLAEFLRHVLARFAGVGLWTVATSDYARGVASMLVDPARLAFIYSRGRCTAQRDPDQGRRYWVKDIRKLSSTGFDEASILFVDDKPRGLERSYANLVPIHPFMGEPDDRELDRLARYLDELGPVEDVRCVDKRGWARREDL